MINGLEGIPGSGKSYEAVVFHVLSALKRGRKVITNLPLKPEVFAALDPEYFDLIEVRTRPSPVLGTFDANRVDDKGQGEAYRLWLPGESLGYESGPRIVASGPFGSPRMVGRLGPAQVFGNVWDYYSEWKDKDGRGPLFIVDECHKAMPKIGTDQEVIDWYKLHRHFNCDVLLATQNFRHMAQDIADLMAMVIKVRKADVLGKPKSYIRKVHAGYRGAVISENIRDYEPQFFPLYQSHTQGSSVSELAADDVQPMLVKFKRFQKAWYVLCLIAVVWAFWPSDKAKPKPRLASVSPASKMAVVTPSAAPRLTPQNQPAPTLQNTSDDQPVGEGEMPEPFSGRGIHLTGLMRFGGKVIYTFSLSNNAVYVASITSRDLEKIGYQWTPLTDCAGALAWKSKIRAVTCDAPRSTVITMASADSGKTLQ